MKRISQRRRSRKKRQRVHYKVWVEIEQFDLDTEDGIDMDAPGGALAEFDTYHEASEFAESLVNELATSRLPNVRR